MCGIAAILFKNDFHHPRFQQGLENSLNHMIQAIEHRGPDSSGTYIGDGIGLGMARLAIVGGMSGVQPIWNEDRTIAVVCNGEIYNYHALHAELELDGHKFSTASDVEVIVHLYEQYQEECIKYLEGIFAFALWDQTRKKLFVARDRFGVKPLYFAETKERFLFASELRALLIHPDVNSEIDNVGLTEYHMFRFVPGDKTVVAGIHKLRPAECIVFQSGRDPIHHSYWSAGKIHEAAISRAPFKEKVSHLKQKLFDAVLSQEASYVKSGILLSGGLDSSALLAIHHQLFGQVPDTFTVSFTPPRTQTRLSEYNEIDNAASVANHYGAKHTSACYTPEQVLEQLPAIIAALDEPIADPTAIPLWFACQLSHQSGVRVLFSGEGLDELFNGYSVYRQVYWLQALNKLPKSVRKMAICILRQMGLPGSGVIQKSLLHPAEWYQGVGGTFQEHELKAILTDKYVSRLEMDEAKSFVQGIVESAHSVGNKDILRQLTVFDMLAWLPENTLTKSDKISMAHSIELRVPFLDRHIVEFALKMNKRDKLRGKSGKWIVRSALTNVVPKEVLRRKKAGFPVPLSAWMFNEWREYVLSTLLDPNAITREMYKPSEVEALFNTPEKNRRRAARLLWTLFSYELWERQVHAASTDLRSHSKTYSSSHIVSTALQPLTYVGN